MVQVQTKMTYIFSYLPLPFPKRYRSFDCIGGVFNIIYNGISYMYNDTASNIPKQ